MFVSSWGEMFGDEVVAAAAIIDRLVHDAKILALKSDSHRSRQERGGAAGARLLRVAGRQGTARV